MPGRKSMMRQYSLILRLLVRGLAIAGIAGGASSAQDTSILSTPAVGGTLKPAMPTSALWTFIGPNNTVVSAPGSPAIMGPSAVAGRVNAMAFDPKNINIYYAATASGGI